MRKHRYELMSQEELMNAYEIPNVNSGSNRCKACIICKNNPDAKCIKEKGFLCSDIVKNYLRDSLDVIKRYEAITDDESVSKICSVYEFYYADHKKSLSDFLCEWVEKGKEFEHGNI